ARLGSGSHTTGMQLGWNVAPAVSIPLENPTLTNTWQLYAFLIRTGSSVEANGNLYITIAVGAGQPAGTVWIDAVSVTEGDVIGGFAPAPEDILPGTISADRLNVANLAAISANLGSITAGSLNAV